MKKSIIAILIITALCPIKIMAQLALNSTFNKKDTMLIISLVSVSDKNDIVLLNEYYHSGDGGSYLNVSFLDNNGKIITESKYGFIVNNIPKRFFQIKPKQKLDFRFDFTTVRQNYNLKGLKKLRVKFWLKYGFNNKLIEKGLEKEFLFE